MRAPEALRRADRIDSRHMAGPVIPLRLRSRELTDLNRDLIGTNRAVTALLSELGQQAEELGRRAAGTESFVRALAHELRTPLYAVRGMAEAILRDGGDDLDARLREDVR